MIDAVPMILEIVQACTVDLAGEQCEMHCAPLSPQCLPEASGIYMVFDERECLYIGQSKNIRKRWKQHHRHDGLMRISGALSIAWIEAPEAALHALETQLIMQLRPRLNGTPIYIRAGQQIFIRMADELVDRLDSYVTRMAEERPGLNPTRSDAIRILLIQALDAEEPRGHL